jgi:hypothetical protein
VIGQIAFAADEEILHHPHQGAVSHIGCHVSPHAGGTAWRDNRDDAGFASQRIALPFACGVS